MKENFLTPKKEELLKKENAIYYEFTAIMHENPTAMKMPVYEFLAKKHGLTINNTIRIVLKIKKILKNTKV